MPILDDGIDEPVETLSLTLSGPVQAVLDSPFTAVLTIVDDNDAPVAVDDTFTVAEDSQSNALYVLANDTDPELNPLVVSAVGAPNQGGTATSAGTHIIYTPALNFNGVETFTYTAADGQGGTDSATVTVNVTAVNDAPVLAPIGAKNVDEGALLSFTATATDIDLPPNSLSYSLDAGAPAGASIDPVTGLFTWTPSEAQGPGVYPVAVRVTDDGTPPLDDCETIQITVAEVNQAPVLVPIGDKSVDEGVLLSFTASATDADLPPNSLTFSLDAGAPAGASIDPATGLFAWTPGEAQGPGVYPVTVRVTDNGTPPLDDYETIQITVVEVNLPPVAVDDGYTTPEDIPLVVVAPGVLGNDSDGDLPPNPLTAVLEEGPVTGSLDLHADGSFAYTPTLDYSGVVTFTYYVSDGLAASAEAVVSITVTPVCDCAVELEPPSAVQAGDTGTTVTYTLRVTNSGECADALDVTVAALWLTGAPATVGPLAAGAGTDVVVTVVIPAGAGDGDQDVATITFTSQSDGAVSAVSVLTTTANVPTYRVYLPLVLRGARFGGVRGEVDRVDIYPE